MARDPSFARAWAALADAYLLVVPYAGGTPAITWEKAKAAANKALALDSRSAEAYTALGYGWMIYGWDWKLSEENFRRAIAADSNYATGHHWYGDFLVGRGRLEHRLQHLERLRGLAVTQQRLRQQLARHRRLWRQLDELAEVAL